MARPKRAEAGGQVAVRVLLDCHLGRCNEVVELPAEMAAQAVDAGLADDHPDAVAYASNPSPETES